ncbi:arylsulfatase [Neolewinella agarilytica]|uniref:arylsulfatase n=1 Tax=Neolewinella agarilytica TaxID=478744 RepID=UPI002355BB3E|nr:arylsulfatase [Neolewinella agarilytica]
MSDHAHLFLLLLTFSVLTGSCEATSGSSQQKQRPNVVLLITDDQGYGDLSVNGNPYLSTPNLDEIYRSSTVLTDFHVDPVCAPTRAALMTGRYSARTGVWMTYMGRHHLAKEETTMADMFSANGYRTGIFGKWHLGDNYPFRPSDRGFEESLVHGGGVIGETPDYWGNDYYDDIYLRNDQPEQATGYCTDVWFREAMKFIDGSVEDDKPFFLYLSTNAPHGPLNVPRKYVVPFLNNPDIPDRTAWFYGMITSIDENVGKFRRYLKDKSLLDNTVFIYMTDNGTRDGYVPHTGKGFNAGMRNRKGSPYEGGHRVPFAISWPAGGLDGYQEIDRITAHLDVFPTLVELLDLELAKRPGFDGQSIVPLLENPATEAWPDRTLCVHNQVSFGQKLVNDLPVKYKKYAVMNERWRLVNGELYDIVTDPGQSQDVAKAHPETVDSLRQFYDQWWASISTNFDRDNASIVGSEEQKDVVLSAQFWHGDYVPYSQEHVRSAMVANGFWDIDVVKSGTYQISLRRWPRESGVALRGEIPPPNRDSTRFFPNDQHYQYPSKQVMVDRARLRVGDFDQTVSVSPDQAEVSFKVELPEGQHFLKSWLMDTAGDSLGAYYVYVEPLAESSD